MVPDDFSGIEGICVGQATNSQYRTGCTVVLAEDGARCLIEQHADPGQWSQITGQTEPIVQGWYSRRFNESEPSPVLYYTTTSPVRRCEFVTQITIEAPQPGAPPD